VFPTERRYVLQQHVGDGFARLFQMRDHAVEINCIPVHDRADDEIEAGGTKGLAVERPIADFAPLVEEYRSLELVGGLALVETGLTPPTQCWARVPFDHEQRA